ncbi:MAG: NAD-dependent protein deacylase [Oscillospiraceae bacterium]|nr:NAD-dependent protein deacylase [Oscillospiraceae bacterium]
MNPKIEQLREWISEADNIVFFGGAGVSTESGIPDFRSVDGLYNQKYKYPPETIISRSFFCENLHDFFEFYRDKLLHLNAKPNAAHFALAKLEEAGKLKAIVTQNIDGLHQAAGSKNVIEIHGSVHRNYCLRCGVDHNAEYIKNLDGPPPCVKCGGLVKPDVVLYEEALSRDLMGKSKAAIAAADMLIVGGTSLSVYPANNFVDYYDGHKLVLINTEPTHLDARADLLFQERIGEVLGKAVEYF